MRTTLTIDDDVAAALERLQKKRGASFEKIVNDLLRSGLKEPNARPVSTATFRTPAVDLGELRIASIDNVARVLNIAEGEAFK